MSNNVQTSRNTYFFSYKWHIVLCLIKRTKSFNILNHFYLRISTTSGLTCCTLFTVCLQLYIFCHSGAFWSVEIQTGPNDASYVLGWWPLSITSFCVCHLHKSESELTYQCAEQVTSSCCVTEARSIYSSCREKTLTVSWQNHKS